MGLNEETLYQEEEEAKGNREGMGRDTGAGDGGTAPPRPALESSRPGGGERKQFPDPLGYRWADEEPWPPGQEHNP